MKKQFLPGNILKTTLMMACLCTGAKVHAQWTTVDTAGFQPSGNLYEHVFFDAANTPYVSFSGLHGEVMKYNGATWVFVGSADITAGGAQDSWSAIAPNGNIYFSYADGTDSSMASVLMYNGTAWTTIGDSISAGAVSNTNMVVSSTGVLYLSYLDNGTSPGYLYVKKYVSGTWSTVGSGAIDTTGVGFPSLAIDHNDSLYIAYEDAAATQKVIVKKYSGGNWVMTDTAFSAQPEGSNVYISLVTDQANVPYVSYLCDYPAGPSVCVSKYDGTHWETLGAPSFTSTASGFSAMAIDHNNTPYVVYTDNMIGSLSTVMKYNGTNWVMVGTAGFSIVNAIFCSIAIDGNNNPYTSFLDGDNGGTTVMKYPVCTPSSAATVTSADSLICKGSAATMTATGTLNNATNWYWYTGSCSGTPVDSGATIAVTPNDTTTYYVHGNGGCVLMDSCTSFTINVDSVAMPVIYASGALLTSSATSGNQWYMGGTPIAGATGETYSVTATGWYKVADTNSTGCSKTSDSVFVSITSGVANINQAIRVNVYPSPVTDILNIEFTDAQYNPTNTNIYITDNLGLVIATENNPAQKSTLNLKNIPAGIYFVNIVTDVDKQVMKIVKE